MQVIYRKTAKKTLLKMPPKLARLIADKVEAFAANPRGAHADVKRLEGTQSSYRLRQGGWRAVLTIVDDTLVIEKIAPRGDVYK